MAQKLTGALAPDLDLTATFQIRLTAIDPTSGATVAGVNVSNVAILATQADPDALTEPPAPLPPLYVPIPDEPVAA